MWALARLRHPPPPRLLDALASHLAAAAAAAPAAPQPSPAPTTQSLNSPAAVAPFAPGGGGGAPYRLLQLAAVAGACAKLGVRQRHPLWEQLAAAAMQVRKRGRRGTQTGRLERVVRLLQPRSWCKAAQGLAVHVMRMGCGHRQ